MNPFVFIVGCPRSGTTLLQRIVNEHPQIAIIHETRWIPDFFQKRIGLTPEGLVTPDLVSRLCAHKRFPQLEMNREEVEKLAAANGSVTYANFVSALFDLYGKLKGKQLVGDKTPAYVRKLATLHSLWPQAKVVHLIRDGRDTCLSILAWKKSIELAPRFPTWSQQPVMTVALWWKVHVGLGREMGISLGPGLYYEVRYESLIAQPAEECAKLCAFLGVPYDDGLLRFHEGRVSTEPGLDAKRAWKPITAGLRDWRAQMPAEDVERFEAAAGEVLNELGYRRAFAELRPAIRNQAIMVHDKFTQDAVSRGRLLPKRWSA